MLFTIVFNEGGLTLDTTDIETAFHACDMPQLVDAVINAETGKILWGSLEHPVKSAETKKKSTVSPVQAQVVNSTMMQSLSPWQKSGRFLTVQTLVTITAL